METGMKQGQVREVMDKICQSYRGRLVMLPDKPEETVEATVRALWLCAAGVQVSARKALEIDLAPLSVPQLRELEALLEQRLLGAPLAHLTGRQSFMDLEFVCTKDALIPRRETELLATAACQLLSTEITTQKPRVLDLCCGSGNVACAVASRVPSCEVVATDLSPEAVLLAKENARRLGCSKRLTFAVGDLFGPVASDEHFAGFDLITCNPPYITTGKLASLPQEIIGHEPRLAFDGGPLGVAVMWRLLQEAPRFLKDHGWLAFEVGLGQGTGMLNRVVRLAQYTNVRAVSDEAGNPRAILAQAVSQHELAGDSRKAIAPPQASSSNLTISAMSMALE